MKIKGIGTKLARVYSLLLIVLPKRNTKWEYDSSINNINSTTYWKHLKTSQSFKVTKGGRLNEQWIKLPISIDLKLIFLQEIDKLKIDLITKLFFMGYIF